MEATIKQLNYIRSLSKRLNRPVSDLFLSKLNAESASKYIDGLTNVSPQEVQQQPGIIPEAVTKVNGVRLGLACKLVLQQGQLDFFIDNPTVFVEKSIKVYGLLNKVEERIGSSAGAA